MASINPTRSSAPARSAAKAAPAKSAAKPAAPKAAPPPQRQAPKDTTKITKEAGGPEASGRSRADTVVKGLQSNFKAAGETAGQGTATAAAQSGKSESGESGNFISNIMKKVFGSSKVPKNPGPGAMSVMPGGKALDLATPTGIPEIHKKTVVPVFNKVGNVLGGGKE